MKTQLLATFCKRNRLYESIDLIIACNDIVFDKIYVFQNENDYHQLICTYNIEVSDDFIERVYAARGITTAQQRLKKEWPSVN